jgi:hypothetical protein
MGSLTLCGSVVANASRRSTLLSREPQQFLPSFAPMTGLPPSPGTDWTDHEREEIGRLEALCRKLEHWELECTHTDAGDPWCVIYDRRREAVGLHVARIDRRYIVEWPPRQRSVTMATIESAIDIALAELTVPP